MGYVFIVYFTDIFNYDLRAVKILSYLVTFCTAFLRLQDLIQATGLGM